MLILLLAAMHQVSCDVLHASGRSSSNGCAFTAWISHQYETEGDLRYRLLLKHANNYAGWAHLSWGMLHWQLRVDSYVTFDF